jgi:hypothetical protein
MTVLHLNKNECCIFASYKHERERARDGGYCGKQTCGCESHPKGS